MRAHVRPSSYGIGETAALQDALFGCKRVVSRTDLRRAHMELAQPNRRIIGIECHGAIVQQENRKTKPAGGRAIWVVELNGAMSREGLR